MKPCSPQILNIIPYRGGRALLIDSLHIIQMSMPTSMLQKFIVIEAGNYADGKHMSLQKAIEDTIPKVDYVLILTSYPLDQLPLVIRNIKSKIETINCFRIRTSLGRLLERDIEDVMQSSIIEQIGMPEEKINEALDNIKKGLDQSSEKDYRKEWKEI